MNVNEILGAVLELVITVGVIIFCKYLIPYLKKVAKESEYNMVYSAIDDAVKMAEQTIRAKGSGSEKKQAVLDIIDKVMIDNNINMSEEQINSIIESAVFIMNKEKKDE